MQKITTFLWFDNYTSIFKNSKMVTDLRQGQKVLTATFELEGQRFIALKGGPHYKFTEAICLAGAAHNGSSVNSGGL